MSLGVRPRNPGVQPGSRSQNGRESTVGHFLAYAAGAWLPHLDRPEEKLLLLARGRSRLRNLPSATTLGKTAGAGACLSFRNALNCSGPKI